jgi:hypothetical protein
MSCSVMSPRRISILMCDTVEVTFRQQKAPGDVGAERALPGGGPTVISPVLRWPAEAVLGDVPQAQSSPDP